MASKYSKSELEYLTAELEDLNAELCFEIDKLKKKLAKEREKNKLQLASRPTCGKEQRKFLDEVEKLKYEVILGCDGLAKELGDDQPIIYGSDFDSDLQKVIKGE